MLCIVVTTIYLLNAVFSGSIFKNSKTHTDDLKASFIYPMAEQCHLELEHLPFAAETRVDNSHVMLIILILLCIESRKICRQVMR